MLIQYQSFKEISKITDMPILQGETVNEITCPAEKTINLGFPVPETSSYSSTLPVIKSGYISIYTLLKKCIFSKSIMKVSTVRKVAMEAFNTDITEPSNRKQPLQTHPYSTT